MIKLLYAQSITHSDYLIVPTQENGRYRFRVFDPEGQMLVLRDGSPATTCKSAETAIAVGSAYVSTQLSLGGSGQTNPVAFGMSGVLKSIILRQLNG